MEKGKEKRFDFRTIGIVIVVTAVILSLLWVTVVNFFGDDANNDVTWVG